MIKLHFWTFLGKFLFYFLELCWWAALQANGEKQVSGDWLILPFFYILHWPFLPFFAFSLFLHWLISPLFTFYIGLILLFFILLWLNSESLLGNQCWSMRIFHYYFFPVTQYLGEIPWEYSTTIFPVTRYLGESRYEWSKKILQFLEIWRSSRALDKTRGKKGRREK